jgi:hypothetical protein
LILHFHLLGNGTVRTPSFTSWRHAPSSRVGRFTCSGCRPSSASSSLSLIRGAAMQCHDHFCRSTKTSLRSNAHPTLSSDTRLQNSDAQTNHCEDKNPGRKYAQYRGLFHSISDAQTNHCKDQNPGREYAQNSTAGTNLVIGASKSLSASRECRMWGSQMCQHQRGLVLVITNNRFWCHHAPFGRVLPVGIVVLC